MTDNERAAVFTLSQALRELKLTYNIYGLPDQTFVLQGELEGLLADTNQLNLAIGKLDRKERDRIPMLFGQFIMFKVDEERRFTDRLGRFKIEKRGKEQPTWICTLEIKVSALQRGAEVVRS